MKQYVGVMRSRPFVPGTPLDVKDTVFADSVSEAKRILESRHHGRHAFAVREVPTKATASNREPTERPSLPLAAAEPRRRTARTKAHAEVSQPVELISAETPDAHPDGHSVVGGGSGCGALIVKGLILFVLASTAWKVFRPSEDFSGMDDASKETTAATAIVSSVTAPVPAASGHEANADTLAVQGEQSPEVEPDSHYPHIATIVDRRRSIVLQSGPGITSRNVASIPTGSRVRAGNLSGKWVLVRTEGGQTGYVRRKQLELVP